MKSKYLWTGILAAYLLLVFSNSLRPAPESSQQSRLVLLVVKEVLAQTGMGGFGITEHMVRKMAHFTEYWVMGMLLWRCLALYQMPASQRASLAVVIGFAAPFVDETMQLFVKGRSGQISDVWLDCFGAAVGYLLVYGISKLAGRRARRKTAG